MGSLESWCYFSGVDIIMSEWISIKDRLPKDCTKVLLCSNGKNISCGYVIIIHGEVFSINYDGVTMEKRKWNFRDVDITHWQPLPALP